LSSSLSLSPELEEPDPEELELELPEPEELELSSPPLELELEELDPSSLPFLAKAGDPVLAVNTAAVTPSMSRTRFLRKSDFILCLLQSQNQSAVGDTMPNQS
jgi:hypothetical protein